MSSRVPHVLSEGHVVKIALREYEMESNADSGVHHSMAIATSERCHFGGTKRLATDEHHPSRSLTNGDGRSGCCRW